MLIPRIKRRDPKQKETKEEGEDDELQYSERIKGSYIFRISFPYYSTLPPFSNTWQIIEQELNNKVLKHRNFASTTQPVHTTQHNNVHIWAGGPAKPPSPAFI